MRPPPLFLLLALCLSAPAFAQSDAPVRPRSGTRDRARQGPPTSTVVGGVSAVALAGGGVAFFLLARAEEARIGSFDGSIQTDADLLQAEQRGRLFEVVGLTLIGAGAATLTTTLVLHYLQRGYTPPRRTLVLAPLPEGGGMALLRGTF